WGFNDVGQMGDGTSADRSIPVRVPNLPPCDRISAGYAHALARARDGTLWTWGDNGVGELGDASALEQLVPRIVPGLAGVRAIAAGDSHVLALKDDGSVWGWGNNAESQLGDGTRLARSSPAPIAGVSGASIVSAGSAHSVAVAAGTVIAWGDNGCGQLGRGDNLYSDGLPGAVPGLAGVVALSAGYAHNAAVRSDGSLWTWGCNESGELGDGTTTNRSSPTRVALDNVAAVSASYAHTLALTRDGSVWAFGDNSRGQLGDGSLVSRSVPARVPGLDNIVAIAAAGSHSLALRSDGSVWAWGDNDVGTLGDGTVERRLLPVAVKGLPAISALAAALTPNYGFSLAVAADGSTWSWGDYRNGQLGDGALVERDAPVVVLHEDGTGSVAGNDWFLDLDPSIPTAIPADKVPVFLLVTQADASNVTAKLQFRPQDVGSQGEVYVFAVAPAAVVKDASAAKRVPGDPFAHYTLEARGSGKDISVACVLAQLDASGQLRGVSVSTLQAYVKGVLGAQGTAVTILNGVPTINIAGATFYVGYGSNPASMINNGLNRSAVTIPGTATCQPQPPRTGWWWNPAEDGRGFSIEVRGNHIFFASFLYDVSGRATWYVSSGAVSLDGSLYSDVLYSAKNGQTLGGAYR
ncbi:MAG TPA: hypothetical protein VF945_09540, partial [Polyangia bacterium]